MKISHKFLKNLAISLALFTIVWVLYDFYINYNEHTPIYKKANENFLNKNYKDALNFYTKAFEKNNENLYALEGQARSLMRLKLYNQAEKKFKEVIKRNKDFAVAYANLGILYDTIGEYKKAIYYYDVAISKNARLGDGINWLSRLLKNIQFKPSNIKNRKDFLIKQLQLTPNNRNLNILEQNKIQPDFQM